MTASPVPGWESAILQLAGGDTSSAEDDTTSERILDAAEVIIAKFGLRRANVDDIAAAANVHRGTVYRRFSNKDEMFGAVLRRIAVRMIRNGEKQASTTTPGLDQLIEGYVSVIEFFRRDPFMSGLMSTEPSLVLPFITTEAASIIDFGRNYLAAKIRLMQADGKIDAAIDGDAAAEFVLRMTQSIILTDHVHIPLDTEDQLRSFAKEWLFPAALQTPPRPDSSPH